MFKKHTLYKRSKIHDTFGGNRQRGISVCADGPFIFLFSGVQGGIYGYKDGWLNRHVYTYTGEGTKGDMRMTGGNWSLAMHQQNSKRVFLFEYVQKGYVEFIEELEVFDLDTFEATDVNGNWRLAFKFYLKKVGHSIPYEPEIVTKFDSLRKNEKLPEHTEVEQVSKRRVGQSAFRTSLFHRWSHSCAVTGVKDGRVLIASHIVPWSTANDTERLDVDNGLLLSPTYDSLFDKNIITFDDAGKIILGKSFSKEQFAKLRVTGKEKIQQDLSSGNTEYLERHNKEFLNFNGGHH